MERWILDVAKHVYLLAFQQCKSWTDSSTLVTNIIAIAGEETRQLTTAHEDVHSATNKKKEISPPKKELRLKLIINPFLQDFPTSSGFK